MGGISLFAASAFHRQAGLLPASASAPAPFATPAASPSPTPLPEHPIEHVVVLLQENHTFDNYFGTFPGANGVSLEQLGRCSDWTTPGTTPCQWTEEDIPYYWHLARTFGLSDNYFTAVNGPSYPNHYMLLAAQTPALKNPGGNWGCPTSCFDVATTLPDLLTGAGYSWQVYTGPASWDVTMSIRSLFEGRHEHPLRTHDELFADIKNGALPNVAWIKPTQPDSEHPKGNEGRIGFDLRKGEQWVSQVVETIKAGPQWAKTAIFITWDDWGGLYDHVTQQHVEDLADPAGWETWRNGPRVPLLVVSPWAKSGYLSHVAASHLSIVRFIEKTFGLPPINERDAGASDLSDFFTFSPPSLHLPVPSLPKLGQNLLGDPSFEERLHLAPSARPEGWVTVGITPSDGYDEARAHNSPSSFRMVGERGTSKRLWQRRYNLTGEAGDMYEFSGWSMAEGADDGSQTFYSLAATVYGGTESQLVAESNFTGGTHDWQRATVRFTTKAPYAFIDLYAGYSGNGGTVWFDDFSLIKLPK